MSVVPIPGQTSLVRVEALILRYARHFVAVDRPRRRLRCYRRPAWVTPSVQKKAPSGAFSFSTPLTSGRAADRSNR